MRMMRVLAGLAVLSTAGAAALRADFRDFSNFCSPGAVRTCASIQVYTTSISGPGSGTSVVILVRNLQGWGYGVDNTGGSVITRIGLVAPTIAGATGLTVVNSGAGQTGNPGLAWNLRNPGGLGGAIELTAGVAPGSVAGGIVGCNAPQGYYPSDYFQTCGGGWIAFAFTTTNDWSANDAQVAWLTQNFQSPIGGGVECDTNGGLPENPNTHAGRAACVNVTPEPITMLLLGSGLAGVGGAGLVRRRRGKDIVSE